jgi:hypothetical protein
MSIFKYPVHIWYEGGKHYSRNTVNVVTTLSIIKRISNYHYFLDVKEYEFMKLLVKPALSLRVNDSHGKELMSSWRSA